MYTEQSKISLSDIELEMLDTSFSNFNRVEFAKLMRSGQWETVDKNITLTTQNEVPKKLYFIQNGTVSIMKNTHEIAKISDGNFIGEMSLVNNGSASATTITRTRTQVITWDRQSLEKLLTRNPTLSILLKHSISVDLTKKIKNQP